MEYNNPSKKGGIILSATGYIQVHAYSSYAQLPLEDVAITITATDNTVIAMRLTNSSGRIIPVPLPVPDLSAGQTPDTGIVPFTRVNLHARLRNYEQITINDLQVFPDVTTLQNLEMIPLSELPNAWDQSEDFNTPSQNL